MSGSNKLVRVLWQVGQLVEHHFGTDDRVDKVCITYEGDRERKRDESTIIDFES